jgi:hypothetical protein
VNDNRWLRLLRRRRLSWFLFKDRPDHKERPVLLRKKAKPVQPVRQE